MIMNNLFQMDDMIWWYICIFYWEIWIYDDLFYDDIEYNWWLLNIVVIYLYVFVCCG